MTVYREQRWDEDEPLYVISVAARMVRLHSQTLRYYEREGLVEPARSTRSRHGVPALSKASGLR